MADVWILGTSDDRREKARLFGGVGSFPQISDMGPLLLGDSLTGIPYQLKITDHMYKHVFHINKYSYFSLLEIKLWKHSFNFDVYLYVSSI